MKIGIPVSFSNTQYYINQAYVKYVADAGYEPVLLSPESSIKTAVSLIDGLIMPGGIDVDPIYYGYDNFSSYAVDPLKDEFERELFHSAREAKLPILGICRGFQLIIYEYMEHDNNLIEFMEFKPHISGHNQVDGQRLPRTISQHFVDYNPSTLYNASSTKADSMPVNSMHHQCLVVDFKRNGIIGIRNFRMGAWTTRGIKVKTVKDSNPMVCEAFRISKWGAPILAVQWHPEEIKDYELLHQFFGNVKADTMETT